MMWMAINDRSTHEMIRAAAERRHVLLDDGKDVTLVRWPTRGKAQRARVQNHRGLDYTVAVNRIVAVSAPAPRVAS